jgi:hypothetical protein
MPWQKRVGRSSGPLVLCLFAIGCGSSGQKPTGTGGQGGAGNAPTSQVTLTFGQTTHDQVDILFVINDMASTGANQQKLANQLPSFLDVLKSSPTPLDLHIAVATTDMGVPSDVQQQIGCSATGDDGQFRSAATGTCTSTTLAAGATYLADDGRGTTNFSGSIATALQCISLVGDGACEFGQPLAAAVHALGADDLQGGAPTPPPTNAGFLRPDANLAIILLVNEDDCSVPAGTELFSLQGQPDDLSNPLGPFDHYRCNRYGHLCHDPASASPAALISPPLNPPPDAQGTGAAPALDLVDCQDNDTATGLLTPVSAFVNQIRALKPDPDDQILVAALVAPASPYTVAWMPAQDGQNAHPTELWPEVQESCGARGASNVSPSAQQFTTDGTFGEPGVRLTQFANGFSNKVVASVCDASYATTMTAIANQIAQLPSGRDCLKGTLQRDVQGRPSCSVAAQVVDGTTTKTVQYPSCADTGNAPPCWTVSLGAPNCTGAAFSTMDAPGAPSASVTVTCTVCNAAGGGAPGC